MNTYSTLLARTYILNILAFWAIYLFINGMHFGWRAVGSYEIIIQLILCYKISEAKDGQYGQACSMIRERCESNMRVWQ